MTSCAPMWLTRNLPQTCLSYREMPLNLHKELFSAAMLFPCTPAKGPGTHSAIDWVITKSVQHISVCTSAFSALSIYHGFSMKLIMELKKS